MMPGMNPRMMKQAFKRLGIQQQDIDATEVIIRTHDKEILIRNPQVAKVNMMGQETFQIVGNAEEKSIPKEPEISQEDIQTVMGQAEADENKARAAINKHNGDLAAAIIELKQDRL